MTAACTDCAPRHEPLPVDAEAIRALADILLETGLTEIEIAEGTAASASCARPRRDAGRRRRAAALSAARGRRAGGPARRRRSISPSIPAPSKARWSASPICRPSPARRHFVSAGQPVTAGQTLLLIEAMKTFNQIKAPRAGT